MARRTRIPFWEIKGGFLLAILVIVYLQFNMRHQMTQGRKSRITFTPRNISNIPMPPPEDRNEKGENIRGSSAACQEEKQLAKQIMWPYTALASFQGSGSAWLRHLIETTTGKLLPVESHSSRF